MYRRRPSYWKEKVIKEEVIVPCSFCSADSVGKFSQFYFCRKNDCIVKLWAEEKAQEQIRKLPILKKKKKEKLTKKTRKEINRKYYQKKQLTMIKKSILPTSSS